jgi:hypothetical protein
MNPWFRDPRVIDLLQYIGSAPLLLSSLFIAGWALRSLYTRPYQGWLMLAVVGLQLFSMYGVSRFFSMLSGWVGPGTGFPILNVVSLAVTVVLSVTMWTMALLAVYGGDDRIQVPDTFDPD